MKHHRRASGLDKYIDDIKSKQNNIIWPNPLRNSGSVDAFLFKGSANPRPVQRVAAWLFGLTYIAGGVIFLGVAWHVKENAWIPASLGVALLAVGIWIFHSGVRRHRGDQEK